MVRQADREKFGVYDMLLVFGALLIWYRVPTDDGDLGGRLIAVDDLVRVMAGIESQGPSSRARYEAWYASRASLSTFKANVVPLVALVVTPD